MILDDQAIFSDAQAITGDAASTNIIDLGAPGVTAYNQAQLVRNLGKGKHIPLLIQVVEDFDALTSLEIIVQGSVDEAFTSPVAVMSETVPLGELVVGRISRIDKVPREFKFRYMRIFYNVNGANPTVGQITAGIVGAVDGSYQG